jgi:NADPH:quinone reductase-like Zn-dependent oxidoreductase
MPVRIQYHSYGGPDVMELQPYELVEPAAGDVAVGVVAAAINPIDWKLRQGQLKVMTGRKFPRGMGSDFAGVVRAVGAGVTQFAPGDEVFGITRLKDSGAFAQVTYTSQDFLAQKPAGVSFIDAAAAATPGVLAVLGLTEKAKLRPGQRVLVNGCTGGVGEVVTQLALSLGAEVAGTCSSRNVDRARALGVHHVVAHDTGADPLHELAFDVVFDTAGTLVPRAAMKLLTGAGVYLDINATPGKFLHSFTHPRHKIINCAPSRARMDQVAEALTAHLIHASVTTTVPLSQARELITSLEQGQPSTGRSVITIA